MDSRQLGRAVILTIDMHKGHLADNATVPVPRAREIVPKVLQLLSAARKFAVPIIHLRFVAVDGIHNTNPFFLTKRPDGQRHNIEGTEMTEFVVKPEEGDFVISTKRSYSSFLYTDLDLYLRKLNADTVVITGTASEACCLCTAFDAFNRHYQVIALRDCQAGFDKESEESAYRIIEKSVGWVMTSEEFLNLLMESNRMGRSESLTSGR